MKKGFLFVLLVAISVLITGLFSVHAAESINLGEMDVINTGAYNYFVDTTWQNTTIKIGGVEYERGISTHPNGPDDPSQLVYNIEGKGYKVFYAIGGKDASAGAQVGGDTGIKGTKVSMEVWVDGVMKADSGVLAYPAVYDFNVDITGAKELKLVVKEGGDGIYCDATSWANAALYKDAADVPTYSTPSPSPAPTAVPTQDPALKSKDTAYISDMVWQNITAYSVVPDMNNAEEELWIFGEYYAKGVCMHALPTGEVFLDIDIEGLGFTKFAAYTGIAESTKYDLSMASVAFKVYVDGELKYESDIITQPTDVMEAAPTLIQVDVTGGKVLRLAITNGGDSHAGDWGAWGSALLTKKGSIEEAMATPIPTASPIPTATPNVTASPVKTNTSGEKATNTPSVKTDTSEGDGISSTAIIVICIAIAVVIAVVVVIIIVKRKK